MHRDTNPPFAPGDKVNSFDFVGWRFVVQCYYAADDTGCDWVVETSDGVIRRAHRCWLVSINISDTEEVAGMRAAMAALDRWSRNEGAAADALDCWSVDLQRAVELARGLSL